MAIALNSIPVLTGNAAKRFNEIVESERYSERTHIPSSVRKAVRRMEKRSRKLVIK